MDKSLPNEELTDPEENFSKEKPSHKPMIPWLNPELVKTKKSPPYFTTNDLVIIAMFSCLGGIFSTFIGYFANLINNILSFPFGGGQILAGLHIFWLVFIYLLTDRKSGVFLVSGIFKGFVEFFTGNAHGLLVILLSTTQGFILEIILLIFLGTKRNSILILASGLAGVSNIVLQQILFFNAQIPLEFILFISSLSFISGMTLGGFFPISTYKLFRKSQLLIWKKTIPVSVNAKRNLQILRVIFISFLIIFQFTIISFLFVQNKYSIQITGDVYEPYTYFPTDFPKITIEAELIGEVTYVPPKNYSGVPLFLVINRAQPISGTYLLDLQASDGYTVRFNSTQIANNNEIIISAEETGLRIVAAQYPGSYWINKLNKLVLSTLT